MLLIGDDLHYQYKQWTTPFGEQSSNYRELSNLVLGIEGAFHSGPLENWEVFFFTDNTTAEAAFHKGTSYSKPLFDLILRLQTLQMHHGLFLHAIHVAGTWMQQQGTNELSRGCLMTGVMAGDKMLSFVPLHLSIIDSSPSLVAWVHSWAPIDTVDITTPLCLYLAWCLRCSKNC